MLISYQKFVKKLGFINKCIKSCECKFDIIGFSETHLKDNDLQNIDGFNIEYTNRIDRGKGGVCMYVNEKIKYKIN